jgi:uncharacterized protein YuzE
MGCMAWIKGCGDTAKGDPWFSVSDDPAAGARYVKLSPGKPTRQIDAGNGIVLDVDDDNVVCGVEVLDTKRP